MPNSKSSKHPAFFLAYSGVGQRGLSGHTSLQDAKDAAWEMRRTGKSRPVEVLDRGLQVVLSRQELRKWLDLQDREWPEVEGWDDGMDFEQCIGLPP